MFDQLEWREGIIFLKVIYVSDFVETNRNALEALYILLAKKGKQKDFTYVAEIMLDFDLPVFQALRFYEVNKQLKKKGK